MKTRSLPCTLIVNEGDHVTEPSTIYFLVKSQVPSPFSHGPAPPAPLLLNWVVQLYTWPRCGDVDIFLSPRVKCVMSSTSVWGELAKAGSRVGWTKAGAGSDEEAACGLAGVGLGGKVAGGFGFCPGGGGAQAINNINMTSRILLDFIGYPFNYVGKVYRRQGELLGVRYVHDVTPKYKSV